MSIFYDLAPTDWDKNPDGTWANNAAGIAMAQLVDGGEETSKYNRLQSTFSAEMSFWEKMLTVNANFTFMKGNEDYDWFKNKYVIGYGPNDKITRFDAVGGDKRSVVRERQPVPYFITDLGSHTVAAVVVILYDTGQDTVLIVHTAGKVELRFLGGAGDR